MKKTIFTAAVCILATSHAAAQTRKFEGLSLQLDLSANSATTKYSDITPSSLSLGQQSMTAGISGAFTQAFDSRTMVSMGGTVYLGKAKTGGFSFPGSDFSTKITNHFSLFVAPGYTFSPDVLGYAKFSYHRAQFLREDPLAAFSDKTKTRGFGYGLGVKYKIDRKFFVNFEVEKIDFSKLVDTATGTTADFKTSMLQGSVGVGYGF